MKLSIIVLVNLIALTVGTIVTDQEWAQYKRKYGKQYSGYEDTKRRLNLLNNKIYINLHNLRHNSGLVTYRLAVNQFSELTKLEFFQFLGGKNYAVNVPPPLRTSKPVVLKPTTIKPPDFRNWTQDGAGYPISDQGTTCNAGWVFSALAAIEAHYFQVYATLPPKLSVQNIIDCAAGLGACNGLQTPELVYDYIIYHRNVNSEQNYTYTGQQTFCKYNENDVGCNIADFQRILEDHDEDVHRLVAWETPVVVGFNPFSFEFMHYESGIFEPPRNTINIYHKYYMTVIGYGTDDTNGRDYWIFKNSMGLSWGEFGYMKMAREAKFPIAKHATFPNV